MFSFFCFFFFQAEDGIRDTSVTGVQTCALPIWDRQPESAAGAGGGNRIARPDVMPVDRGGRGGAGRPRSVVGTTGSGRPRSEERRVGKEGRARWSPYESKENDDTKRNKEGSSGR